MTSWADLSAAEPEFAGRARRIFSAATNAILATIRADGSPRLSGIDPFFTDDDLCLGCMPGSRKGADLARDPRLALHAVPWESRSLRDGATDPGEADAKVTARAVLLAPDHGRQLIARTFADRGIDQPPEGTVYRLELRSVAVVSVADDQLVIDHWTPGDGLVTVRRS
jgi:hypothetical protein